MRAAILSLIRTPTDEPGRRWSYHRAYLLVGSVVALLVWRQSGVALQAGALFVLVGTVMAALGAWRVALFLAAFGVGLLL